ncbi:MAG: XRE family transcriptional regulator [Bacteroides sp.]|nr:XRE family transcriptional regulator [Bacteroides sp.]MCM1434400.1 XRE family transcriptional regulator [Clostridiales bacterium]
MNRIKLLRSEKNISMSQASKELRIPYTTYVNYEKGEREPNSEMLVKLANYFQVSVDYLIGRTDLRNSNTKLNSPTISTDNVEFAVIGDVAAGFDRVAIEDWTGDKILIPSSYLKSRSKDDFFVLRIKGNSMYPEYRDGDKVLIQKQNAVDYSGQIAVAIYDDELGTIKKIEYKKDTVHLVPINPQYEPVVIKGSDIEKMHILGIPKLLIREIEE